MDLNSSHDMASQFKTFMSFQKKGKAEKEIVNTRDILFIFSGAFHGVEKVIEERLGAKTIGLADKQVVNSSSKKIQTEDLVQFGFEHEFVGRLPVRVSCEPLSQNDLLKVLTESEHSIIEQYKRAFEHYGITLTFTAESLKAVSDKAHAQGTGARALNSVLEEALRPFKFELPSHEIDKLEVTKDLIDSPKRALHQLTSSLK